MKRLAKWLVRLAGLEAPTRVVVVERPRMGPDEVMATLAVATETAWWKATMTVIDGVKRASLDAGASAVTNEGAPRALATWDGACEVERQMFEWRARALKRMGATDSTGERNQ